MMASGTTTLSTALWLSVVLRLSASASTLGDQRFSSSRGVSIHQAEQEAAPKNLTVADDEVGIIITSPSGLDIRRCSLNFCCSLDFKCCPGRMCCKGQKVIKAVKCL